VRALGKVWCEDHFFCASCGLHIREQGMKFKDVDMKPVCKQCYQEIPKEMNRRLKHYDQLVESRRVFEDDDD
jgi:LIM and senescent cell antigen-like-containing domain protein 1/2